MKIIHKESKKLIGERIKVASSFKDRIKGLMFRDTMGDMDGLLIENSNSIHNCFVKFPIDVVFLSRDFKVIKIIRSFKPWRFSWIYFGATRVLELPANSLPEDIGKGDFLEVVHV